MKFRKQSLITLALCIAGCASVSGASDTLELNVGGMPGSDHFVVRLDGDRTLSVTKESLPITPTGLTKSSFSRVLSKRQAGRIISLAKAADDFAQGCGMVADGTSATLVVWHESRSTKTSCSGAATWPKGTKTKSLLLEINTHFSKSLEVY